MCDTMRVTIIVVCQLLTYVNAMALQTPSMGPAVPTIKPTVAAGTVRTVVDATEMSMGNGTWVFATHAVFNSSTTWIISGNSTIVPAYVTGGLLIAIAIAGVSVIGILVTAFIQIERNCCGRRSSAPNSLSPSQSVAEPEPVVEEELLSVG